MIPREVASWRGADRNLVLHQRSRRVGRITRQQDRIAAVIKQVESSNAFLSRCRAS